jgi:hypothetical protein
MMPPADVGGRGMARRDHARKDHNIFMWGTILVVLMVTGLLLWHYHAV